MKKKINILTTIFLLFSSCVIAQNSLSTEKIEKMNKSELKDYTVKLSTKIDSLKNVNVNLQKSISELSQNSLQLEQDNNSTQVELSKQKELIANNEKEIKRIISENETTIAKQNELISKNEKEIKRIISENESLVSKLNENISNLTDSISILHSSTNVFSTSTIAKLNDTILSLRDSISALHSSLNDSSSNTKINTDDFLNKYYFDQVPLPNNSFSLVLTKLIYGNVQINHGSYYDDYDNKGVVIRIPEILDPNTFTYWGVKSNVQIQNKSLNELVFTNTSNYLDSKLPKIEILKNKLFTLKYSNGTEESFLFNSKKTGSNDENNQRGILQMELANEAVMEDGSNNTDNDIVWRFFVIGNDCYLALDATQLKRIGLKIQPNNMLEYFSNGQLRNDNYYNNNYYNNEITSGNGIYLSRNIDSYMESTNYIDPNNLIFLFKLK